MTGVEITNISNLFSIRSSQRRVGNSVGRIMSRATQSAKYSSHHSTSTMFLMIWIDCCSFSDCPYSLWERHCHWPRCINTTTWSTLYSSILWHINYQERVGLISDCQMKAGSTSQSWSVVVWRECYQVTDVVVLVTCFYKHLTVAGSVQCSPLVCHSINHILPSQHHH